MVLLNVPSLKSSSEVWVQVEAAFGVCKSELENIIKINDIVVVDYTEPEKPFREGDGVHRVLGTGTFALQGHDPGSIVFYKEIMVRPLP